MNNKLMLAILIIISFVAVSAVFATVVYAKGSNLLCFQKQDAVITLKNGVKLDTAKEEISKIKYVKITNIKSRDKEWSKMVNKMDLPNMENPFKNEFIIKINKKANINEIFSKIKEMDFVENIEYISDKDCNRK